MLMDLDPWHFTLREYVVHISVGIVEGRWKGLVWHDERVGGRITRE